MPVPDNTRGDRMGHADPLIEIDARQNYWMPFSPNKEFKHEPRMFVRGEGVWLYKPDGSQVIDASSGLFCVAAGHCRPEIAQAVFEQLSTLDYTMPFTRTRRPSSSRSGSPRTRPPGSTGCSSPAPGPKRWTPR
jgi:4-aminobutyrate aminotransferase-like enzyme